ncbi:MAG: tetratricopeptide repeat protein [Desulfoprunum sp.]|uniref:tetratricopeptide repeat protein n=1 Tax=Desulfoprunum sp. TaxID=2020866 RepID=UPI003C766712
MTPMKLKSTGLFLILLAGLSTASPGQATEPSPFALPPASDEEQSATASPFVLPADKQPQPKAPTPGPDSAFDQPAESRGAPTAPAANQPPAGTVVDLGAAPPPAPSTVGTAPATGPTSVTGTPAGGLSVTELLGMGTDFARQGRYEEARVALEKAAAIDPGNVYVLNNLGLVMRRLGRIDEATRAYTSAIQYNPGYALTYKNYGILLEQHGETRRAIDAYRRYASLAPDAPDAGMVSQRADWLAGGY